MTNVNELDLEIVQHLGSLGFSLEDIEKMTETEIAEHCWTEEDDNQAWDDFIASRGQY